MPDFLIKSSGLRWLIRPICFSVHFLPPTPASTPMLQSMTQTKLTLIGLTEIQSNKEFLCDWISGLHIYKPCAYTQLANTRKSTHTFKCILIGSHARLLTHARTPPHQHPLAHSLSPCECIVGNLPSGGGYYITASASLPGPACQTELPWLRQWKIKTTLTGVQSIMEIQKPSSSCE